MTLVIFDLITGILQSFLIAYGVIYCVDGKKINIMKLFIIAAALIIVSANLFTGIFGDNHGLAVLITHIVGILIIVLFYRKNIKFALVAYTIIYSIIGIYTIIFSNLIFEFVTGIVSNEYINYVIIFVIHIPQWIIIFLCVIYTEKINQIYKFIIREKFITTTIIMSFCIDFIITFYLLALGKTNRILRNATEILFLVFIIFILIYFSKVDRKSKEIYELNKALEVKNNELRKINHDYGAEISYLYGLCLMERFNDLKQALKNIINANESISNGIEINDSNNSLLSLVLKPALEKGIHVIIECDGDINSSVMPEMELYRVLSNIVANGIRAMNSDGIIIAKVYEKLNNIVIKIENNGPKIDEKFMDKIFQAGFTTKKNNERNHGFGLSIVKDLIESYNGKISVKSSDISTEFKITLPVKEIKIS